MNSLCNIFDSVRERALNIALAAGMTEEIAEAYAEEYAEGFAAGRAEEQKLIARKMLQKGLDLKLISEVTDLSIEEVKRLEIES